MEVAEETMVMPEMVVDRSPEMLRGKLFSGYRGLRPLLAIFWVTAEDIAEGRKGDGSSCALARAFVREVPDCEKAEFSGEEPAIWIDGERHVVELHRDMVEWIGRFDRDEPVKPIQVYFR